MDSVPSLVLLSAKQITKETVGPEELPAELLDIVSDLKSVGIDNVNDNTKDVIEKISEKRTKNSFEFYCEHFAIDFNVYNDDILISNDNVFLKRCVDNRIKLNDYYSVVYLAQKYPEKTKRYAKDFLYEAVIVDAVKIVRFFVTSFGVDPTSNYAYIIDAVKYGSIKTTKYYVNELKCKITHEIEDSMLLTSKNIKITSFLISKIPDYRDDLNMLEYSADTGNLNLLRFHVEKLKFDLDGVYPVLFDNACYSNYFRIVRYLVGKGYSPADPGCAALERAAGQRHFGLTRYLIEKCGCDPRKVNANLILKSNRKRHPKLAKYLLRKQAEYTGTEPVVKDELTRLLELELGDSYIHDNAAP